MRNRDECIYKCWVLWTSLVVQEEFKDADMSLFWGMMKLIFEHENIFIDVDDEEAMDKINSVACFNSYKKFYNELSSIL